jgi:hypothetical protein
MVEGSLQGFDEAGRLLLESEGKRFPVSAGEVIEP